MWLALGLLSLCAALLLMAGLAFAAWRMLLRGM